MATTQRTLARTGGVARLLVPSSLVAFLVAVLALPASALDLSIVAGDVVFTDLTLDGTNRTTTAVPLAVWEITDLRLTDEPWTVTLSATAPTTAAGSVETTARSIAVSNLVVTTGSFTAGIGSDPATPIVGVSNLVLSTSAQTLVSSPGNTTGIYVFTPTFSLTMPANAYRSNYAGTIGSSSLNPYVSTLTVTIS